MKIYLSPYAHVTVFALPQYRTLSEDLVSNCRKNTIWKQPTES